MGWQGRRDLHGKAKPGWRCKKLPLDFISVKCDKPTVHPTARHFSNLLCTTRIRLSIQGIARTRGGDHELQRGGGLHGRVSHLLRFGRFLLSHDAHHARRQIIARSTIRRPKRILGHQISHRRWNRHRRVFHTLRFCATLDGHR